VNLPKGIETYVTYRHLGGRDVTLDDLNAEIRRWPLDVILGFLGSVSLEMFQRGVAFRDPRYQANFLNRAIVDDFPEPLPHASRIYVPGRVPLTGGHHILVHDHNMAWVAHASLMNSRDGGTTPFTEEFLRRICRILLIANDVLAKASAPRTSDNRDALRDRKTRALRFLRSFQFNRFFGGFARAVFRIARQRRILSLIDPAIFNADAAFQEATGGLSLERYFQVLVLLVTHLESGLGPDKAWLSKLSLCREVSSGREDIEKVIFERWTRSAALYRERVDVWSRERRGEILDPFFDFVPLRETPLIEARPGFVIIPCVSLLLAKIEDDVYFTIGDYLRSNGQDPRRFHTALGKAYERYANELIAAIARQDTRGPWASEESPAGVGGAELADSVIYRGSTAVCFEHKGQRPGTEFLSGGSGDRVLGPSDEMIDRIDSRAPLSAREGKGADDGLLTRGLWQQTINGPALHARVGELGGMLPERMYPIVTHLSGPTVDDLVRPVYLEPLIRRAGLYPEAFWRPPQWIEVDDLEALVALSEKGQLDLEALLEEKAVREPRMRFDIFLDGRFSWVPPAQSLHEMGMEMLDSAQRAFWPETPLDGKE
jgi:hypothetical protein